jgi:hypothetical protein
MWRPLVDVVGPTTGGAALAGASAVGDPHSPIELAAAAAEEVPGAAIAAGAVVVVVEVVAAGADGPAPRRARPKSNPFCSA